MEGCALPFNSPAGCKTFPVGMPMRMHFGDVISSSKETFRRNVSGQNNFCPVFLLMEKVQEGFFRKQSCLTDVKHFIEKKKIEIVPGFRTLYERMIVGRGFCLFVAGHLKGEFDRRKARKPFDSGNCVQDAVFGGISVFEKGQDSDAHPVSTSADRKTNCCSSFSFSVSVIEVDAVAFHIINALLFCSGMGSSRDPARISVSRCAGTEGV